jgi:hypothetical protein
MVLVIINHRSHMTDEKLRLVKSLVSSMPELTLGQLHWIQRVVSIFGQEHGFTVYRSDLFDEETLRNFGEAMRVHHSFSAEPFSKDKFEYVLVTVLKLSGRKANLAPKGNPGHDATIDGVKISLKTQADKGIREEQIWISKFMELGKGQWNHNPADLEGLRQQFFSHMKNYDRILILRALAKSPRWKYELVEIPKDLLVRAKAGRLEMKLRSRQTPKPGYCYVDDENGRKLFDLYFDGGTERKLQIKNLRKDLCRVHAVWEFLIPQE